jgi:hypothetical protein
MTTYVPEKHVGTIRANKNKCPDFMKRARLQQKQW